MLPAPKKSPSNNLARGARAARQDRAACPVIARVFFFFPSFFPSSSHIFSLYTAEPSCFSTLLPPFPLKSSPLFFNFQAQIVYFLHKFAFPTSKLLQFAQFYSTHLPLSLSKTLISIVVVEGCRESKGSNCSLFILLAPFSTLICYLFLQNHHGQETSG